MTSILDNELVRKYFGCTEIGGVIFHDKHDCNAKMSRRVIEAMQQPIKKGERYLDLCCGIVEAEWKGDTRDGLHPDQLRLPDSFQEQHHKLYTECLDCGWKSEARSGTHDPKPEPPKCDSAHLHCECKADRVEFNKFPPDPVEEKIKEFVNKLNRTTDPIAKSSTWWYGRQSIEEALRELVDLVRRER